MTNKRKKQSPESEQVKYYKPKPKRKAKMAQNKGKNPDFDIDVQTVNEQSPSTVTQTTLHNSQFTSGDILQASQTFNLPQTPQYSQYVAMNPGSPLFSQIPTPPTPVYTQQNMDIPGMLNMMLQKLTTMDTMLSQLDAIQTSVGQLTAKVSDMDQKIVTIERKMTDLEKSREFDSSILADLTKKQKEMDSLLSKMKRCDEQQNHRESNLQREVTDLKCRSMRDNLLFYKLPEGKNEDCASTVLHFIEPKLEITDATSTIKLQRLTESGHSTRIKSGL